MNDILTKLTAVLESRKNAAADSSYVAGLYQAGDDVILKKLGEEAAEIIIAGKNGNNQKIIHEAADLWFHSMVLLVHHGINPESILVELSRRFGLSGIDEKTSRSN